ncbi:MAG: tyrosine-protein phosphatase [Chloroflexota bacterium]
MSKLLPEHRHIPLDGVHNLRDLGGYATTHGMQTRWHRFFRADGLHALTEPAQQTLVDVGLRTVIDLRNQQELDEKPDVFATNEAVKYVHLSLFENVRGAGGGLPHNLTEIYLHALDNNQSAFKDVIDVVADSSDSGVLFHCTAGKDRTGLISALLLGVVGVGDEDIVADYALTTHYLKDFFEQRRAEARRTGEDISAYEPLFLSEPQFMQTVLDHLFENYGGIPGYLTSIGISAARIEKIQSVLLQNPET